MAIVSFTRGEYPESTHHVDAAIVDRQKKVLWQTGDSMGEVYWRSGAKPFQVLPLLSVGGAERFHLTEEEIAVMSSSHSGSKYHTSLVESILSKLELDWRALDCGTARPLDENISRAMYRDGEPYTCLHNDCSGKHAGMLGLALIKGYPLSGYKEAGHPVQQEMRQAVAKATGIGIQNLKEGIDGCGVPTFRVPLFTMAFAYAQLAAPEQAFWGEWTNNVKQVRDAMRHYPEAIGGEGRYETNLMQVTGGRLVAKLGAEASLCIGDCEQGLGFACKVQDGGMRAFPHFCTRFLMKNGWLSEKETSRMKELHPPVIRNDHGDVVGRIEISEF